MKFPQELIEISKILNNLKSSWCFLRDPDILKKFSNTKNDDLDIWIDGEYEAALKLLLKNNYIPIITNYNPKGKKNSLWGSRAQFLLVSNKKLPRKIEVHVSDLYYGPFQYARREELVNDLVLHNNMPCISGKTLLSIYTIRLVLKRAWNKYLKQGVVKKIIAQFSEQDILDWQRQMNKFFKPSHVELIVEYINNKTRLNPKSLFVKILINKITKTSFRNLLSLFKTYIQIRYTKRFLFTVAVIGTDGTGKSTLAKAVNKYLKQYGFKVRYKYFGKVRGNTYLVRLLRSFVQKVTGTKNQEKMHVAKKTKKKAIIYCSAFLIYFIEYYIRFFQTIRNGGIIIFDRFLNDLALMPFVSKKFSTQILRILPKPNLIILLNPPHKVIYQRKQERSIDTIKDHQNQYLKQVETIYNIHPHKKINTSEDVDIITEKVVKFVLVEYAIKRLGLDAEYRKLLFL